MKKIWVGFILVSGSLTHAASELAMPAIAPASAPAKGESENRGFSFSLMPRSLQRDPLLEFNVFTELSPAGKTRAQPTAEKPVYYIAQSGGMKASGDVSSGAKSPPAEQIARLVERALEARHFKPAPEGQAAELVVLYHWGTHESPAFTTETVTNEEGETSQEAVSAGSTADELMPKVLGDVRKRKILIDRAAMLGGMAFALELNKALNDEAGMQRAAAGTGMGVSGLMSPFQRFKTRDSKTDRLVEDAFGDCFYMILSAIDYRSVAEKKPLLLWRTILSVRSDGLSLAETISPMISAGKDFFGRETESGILVTKRLNRGGRVDIGEAQVTEVLGDEPAPAAKPNEPKK